MVATEAVAVRVGDFFEESWGYDQTNIDFYQVVRVSASGKSIWLRHVASDVVGGRVAPRRDAFTEDHRFGVVFRRKLSAGWAGAPWISLTSYSGASLWDGQPAYDTIAAGDAGH